MKRYDRFREQLLARFSRRKLDTVLLGTDRFEIRNPPGDAPVPLDDIVSVTVMPLNEHGRPEACLRIMTRDRCVETFRGRPVEALMWLRDVVASAVARV